MYEATIPAAHPQGCVGCVYPHANDYQLIEENASGPTAVEWQKSEINIVFCLPFAASLAMIFTQSRPSTYSPHLRRLGFRFAQLQQSILLVLHDVRTIIALRIE